MNEQEKAEFYELDRMFESKGWRILAAEMQAELDAGPEQYFYAVKSYEDLVAARVRLRAVADLLAYPNTIALRKEDATKLAEIQSQDQDEEDSLEYL